MFRLLGGGTWPGIVKISFCARLVREQDQDQELEGLKSFFSHQDQDQDMEGVKSFLGHQAL